MTTPTAQPASQIIADTLLDLNVIRAGQTPNASQQAIMIRKLNAMMAQWEVDGRRLGYVPIGTVTAILMVPDAALIGIQANLAIYSASAFGATVSQEVITAADLGLETIRKICSQEIPITTDLQSSSDTSSGFNIQIGP